MTAASEGFPRRLRLLEAEAFRKVFGSRCKVHDRNLGVLAARNAIGYPRLGLAISRRCVRSAVQRNRLRRLVRESFRRHQRLLGGLDVVVTSRTGVAERSNQEIAATLQRCWVELARRCGGC